MVVQLHLFDDWTELNSSTYTTQLVCTGSLVQTACVW